MSASNLHIRWAELLVDSLVRAGARDFVVSPGSRSTPLVLAIAKRDDIRTHVIVDERSAAFFALGQARVANRPSVLVCTSGTAPAHYFPAIIEASASFLPLVALTADRPWEDRDTGASQTIDQVKMFGDYVRHFADLGPPDARASSFRSLVRSAAQAVSASLGPIPGPVHVNVQLRKPLEPVEVDGRESWEDEWDALLASPVPRIEQPDRRRLDDAMLDEIARTCASAKRGIVVAGPSPLLAPSDRDAIVGFARSFGFPIFAEATSQLRFGSSDDVAVFTSFDSALRSQDLRRRLAPDCIVELGAAPTSAGYASLLAEVGRVPRFVIRPYGHSDPRGDATMLLKTAPSAFAREIQPKSAAIVRSTAQVEFVAAIAKVEALARRCARAETAGDALTEASIAKIAIDALAENSFLVIGNSNPVRDVDAFADPVTRAIHVLHQRGAAGIDGLLSGAAGAASISNRPTLLLAGDLTFLHDVGGCAIASKTKSPLVALVVQNGGGRIFEELPLHASLDAERAFEPFFATPEPVDLSHVAAAFGASFARPTTTADLTRALGSALDRGGFTIVEAVVSPHDGSARRARYRKSIADAHRAELGT